MAVTETNLSVMLPSDPRHLDANNAATDWPKRQRRQFKRLDAKRDRYYKDARDYAS